jgi:hypothetical protein
VCVGQQRIVDQANARGNARDTGEIPGHPIRMELNSTSADEVKSQCGDAVTGERRVDDGPPH